MLGNSRQGPDRISLAVPRGETAVVTIQPTFRTFPELVCMGGILPRSPVKWPMFLLS